MSLFGHRALVTRHALCIRHLFLIRARHLPIALGLHVRTVPSQVTVDVFVVLVLEVLDIMRKVGLKNSIDSRLSIVEVERWITGVLNGLVLLLVVDDH